MSVGPLGMIASAAGAPLQQTSAETERAEQESAHQTRKAQSDQRAEKAAGVGETEQHEQASDRDADGRRPWEPPPEKPASAETPPSINPPDDSPRSRDATGQRGRNLDLSG